MKGIRSIAHMLYKDMPLNSVDAFVYKQYEGWEKEMIAKNEEDITQTWLCTKYEVTMSAVVAAF